MDADPIARILEWSRSNAHETFSNLRAPASEQSLHEAAGLFGAELPPDLLELYRRFDGEPGATHEYHGQLVPWGLLLSLEASAALRAAMQEALGRGRDQIAGHFDADGFPDRLWPVAGLDADLVVVDLREGEARGSIVYWDELLGPRSGIGWPSLDAFFGQIASALETGASAEHWMPVVVDGMLTWEIVVPDTAEPIPMPTPWQEVDDVYPTSEVSESMKEIFARRGGVPMPDWMPPRGAGDTITLVGPDGEIEVIHLDYEVMRSPDEDRPASD